MKCFYANIRSLVKNKDYVSLILRSTYDILSFSETWLKSQHTLAPLLPELVGEYDIFRCDRPSKKGGGVILLIHHRISASLVFSESMPNAYEIVAVDVLQNYNPFRIIVAYRAPSCLSQGNIQLAKVISDLVSCEFSSVVVGDFNMPGIDWNKDDYAAPSEFKVFTDMLVCHNFKQMVLEPTRCSSILDLVLSNDSELIHNVSVSAPVGLSDHNSVTFCVRCVAVLPVSVYFQDFSSCNYGQVCDYLVKIHWIDVLDVLPSVDEKYETFIEILHSAISLFVPWRKSNAFPSRNLPVYLQNMAEHRICLFNHARITGQWDDYKNYTARFLKQLKKFNRCIEKRIIESGKKQDIYRFLNKRLTGSRHIGSLFGADSIAVSDLEKSELLASTFSKVYCSDDAPICKFEASVYSPMSSLPIFTPTQIHDMLLRWPNSHSLTPDFIPFSFIQNVACVISGPLAYLFNQSLMRSEVPRRWKHTFVTPILKKMPSSAPENYRPVSITSILCRLFERILKVHILDHLDRNGILSAAQHGFVKGKSTETNLIECLNDWTLSLDNKHVCDVIYFDFEKAFDTVSHKRLLFKIRQLKFHHTIVNWIEQFLSGRTFQVRVGSSFSQSRNATSGLPQGGVLSPILFNVFISDLPTKLQSNGVKCKIYADDVKIYREVTCSQDVYFLQDAVDKMVEWSKEWKLKLAPQKTVHLRLGSSDNNLEYNIEGNPIVRLHKIRDLGFLYNDKLDFSEHYKEISRKAITRTFHIFKGLSTNNRNVLMLAYTTYIRPIVESGTTVFNPHKKKDIILLERVQNNFTRKLLIRVGGFFYSRIPRASIRNKYFNVFSLSSRRDLFDVCMVHKIILGEVKLDLRAFRIVPSITRGGQNKIAFDRAKTSLRANFLVNRAGSMYLKLTKNAPFPISLGCFKRKASNFILKP